MASRLHVRPWVEMGPQDPNVTLAAMAEANRALIDRARHTDGRCTSAVLNLGTSVASFTTQASCLVGLNRLLDDELLEELVAEHRRLADDLVLLESLSETSSKSPDTQTLAVAILRRIESLLEREDRIFYQPLLRLAVSDEETT